MLEFIPKGRLYAVVAIFTTLVLIALFFLFRPSTPNDNTNHISKVHNLTCNNWNIIDDALNAGHDFIANASLTSIITLSTKNAWAVGSYQSASNTETDNAPQPLIEHWDGTKWQQVKITDSQQSGMLSAISAVSPDDIWAVGTTQNFITGPLVEHWDGHHWKTITLPTLPDKNDLNSSLSGVAAISANDVWVVGTYTTVNNSQQFPQTPPESTPSPLPTTSPSPTNSAVSPHQINTFASHLHQSNAVNNTLIEHWDGQKWDIVTSPNNGLTNNALNAITALSPQDVWAVGTQDNTPLTMHWDGQIWQIIPNASLPRTPSQSGFNAVAPIPGTPYLWAVGSFEEAVSLSAQQEYQTLIEYWDGQQWKLVPNLSSDRQGYTLNGVFANSPNDAWAVGQSSSLLPLTEHWDGKQWQVVTAPNYDQAITGSFNAISATGTHNVWSVGKFNTTNQINTSNLPLVEQYC